MALPSLRMHYLSPEMCDRVMRCVNGKPVYYLDYIQSEGKDSQKFQKIQFFTVH